MEARNISITLKEAKTLYNSDNNLLKELALRVFSKKELVYNFRDITTFERACKALGYNYYILSNVTENIDVISKASAAMFKLNIIRKALNLGQDLHLTKDSKNSCFYYPYNPFIHKNSTFYADELNTGKMEVIGKIKSENVIYKVLGGHALCNNSYGLGCCRCHSEVSDAYANLGFLGCASEEIAQHFGKYFGMLITEAKYADMVDFEIVEDKYGNTK